MLMIAVGDDISAKIISNLSDAEIEDLTMEITKLRKIDQEDLDAVIHEYHSVYQFQSNLSSGGIDYARSILEKTLGPDKAESIINRLSSFLQVTPFDFVRKTDPAQLTNFIQNEHPQTIALILSYLDSKAAATVMGGLDPLKQADVARRIAMMDRISPEVIRDVEWVLEKNMPQMLSQELSSAGGVDQVVQMLNNVDRATEKGIMETLEEQDPELADEIRNKMFVFEDIVVLDDRAIQQILREVDTKELAVALKGVQEEVSVKIFKNMSKRASSILQEDMQFMGPVRLKDVEESQARIVNIIRNLEEAGDIVIARGAEEELIE